MRNIEHDVLAAQGVTELPPELEPVGAVSPISTVQPSGTSTQAAMQRAPA
ncbi:hypothetical protein EMIT0P74_20333 [Pseudomonas sp. IT-P74]